MNNSWLRQSAFALAAATCIVAVSNPLAVFAATPTATAAADTTTPPPPPPPHREHEHGFRGGPGGMLAAMPGAMGDPFMMAVHQLALTPDQKTSIQSLETAARQAHMAQAATADGALFVTLGNPGDPGYAAALASAKTKAANMIQARSDLDVQIYALLSSDQKTQLPQVLAAMQAKFQARRANWHHGP